MSSSAVSNLQTSDANKQEHQLHSILNRAPGKQKMLKQCYMLQQMITQWKNSINSVFHFIVKQSIINREKWYFIADLRFMPEMPSKCNRCIAAKQPQWLLAIHISQFFTSSMFHILTISRVYQSLSFITNQSDYYTFCNPSSLFFS